MQIKHAFAAVTLIALWPYELIGQQSELDRLKRAKAHVHVLLTDGVGRSIGEGVVVSFKNLDDDKDFAKHFHENNAAAIPYSVYDLEIYKTGWVTARRRVDVFAPDIWLVVGLRPGEELPGFPVARTTVTGKIGGLANAQGPIYVRLVGIYSTYLADTRVLASGDSGTFQVAGVIPDGKFVLLFFDQKKVWCTMPIELPKDKNLAIDSLAGCQLTPPTAGGSP